MKFTKVQLQTLIGNHLKRENGLERSTSAHNTVMVDNIEQNEIWLSFRVGRRARVDLLKDEHNEIRAQHDGFKFMGVIHERDFKIETNSVVITDYLKRDSNKKSGVFYLHFAPNIDFQQFDNKIIGDNFDILFDGQEKVHAIKYQKAIGFNRLEEAKKLKIHFNNKLVTKIKVHP